MCIFDIDKAGFPLVARREEEIFYHFFPLTRVQFEIAIATGWLTENPIIDSKPEAVTDIIDRGEVIYSQFSQLDEKTPEHALPIEIILFPGGYKNISRLTRSGLLEISESQLYSFYLTNLKQAEFASLIQWLGGSRYTCGIPTHQGFTQIHYKFMQFHIRDLIIKMMELDGLNPRARLMLEIFNKYKGVINGLPRDIFEMTGNYVDSRTETIMEYHHSKPQPGLDTAGYTLYYPVIAGETKQWPYIPVQDKIRHLKVEYHPLVGSRGVFKRRR